MVRLKASGAQEQQPQKQYLHRGNTGQMSCHCSTSNRRHINSEHNNNSNVYLKTNENCNNNKHNVPSTSSSTSSLNSNASSTEISSAQESKVMVIPQNQEQHKRQQHQQQAQHQQQQLSLQHQYSHKQQQPQQQFTNLSLHQGQQHHQHNLASPVTAYSTAHQLQHHHHHQQLHSPSDDSEPSVSSSLPSLLHRSSSPPQGTQIVSTPVCAVHHPHQHQQQQLAVVAAMHQAAAVRLTAATGVALGPPQPPPHLHHAHHITTQPPLPPIPVPPVQQLQQQHSQQQQNIHENGHSLPSVPSASPNGNAGNGNSSSTGGAGGPSTIVTAPPPAPSLGPVYIQYPSEFYPAEYYLAPHPHEGICPQHAQHHQTMCAMSTDYGPAAVQMVSQNRPLPVPVQVPQAQVVQQYIHENGTLTHVVLSPQQYQQLQAGQAHIHAPFITGNGSSQFYSPLPTGFAAGSNGGPTHFHAISSSHFQHQAPVPPSPQQQAQHQQLKILPHSPSPTNNYHKDERTQHQHNKLLRKLDQKQREINSAMSSPAHSPSLKKNDISGHHITDSNYINNISNSIGVVFGNAATNNANLASASLQSAPTTTATTLTSNGGYHNNFNSTVSQHRQHHLDTHHQVRRMSHNGTISVADLSGGASSVGTSEDGEGSSSMAEDEDDFHTTITELISSIQKPEVMDISPRSAKIIWEAPMNTHSLTIDQRDLRYNVLLSDRAKECKYKSLYKGESCNCIVQDLQPGHEYVVRLQVHYEKLTGTASEPTEFTTPPCEPEQPMPPKLVVRTKNSLHLRWTSPYANGSPIQHYLLEYDEGKTGAPVSSRLARQHVGQLQFVEAAKTKGKQYTLTKLQPSTIYNFRLAAVNDVGPSMYSPICTFSTSGYPPNAPKPPSLQSATTSSLRLLWERRQQDVEFVLQMLDRETGHGYLSIYNGADCIYECCHLRRATSYQFRLRADNDSGCSPWSNEVTFKTAPDRPSCPGKPQVKGKIHGSYFKVRWEPPADRGGAAILSYFLEICLGQKFERIYSGLDTEAICDRLQPGTTYQLRVSCEGPAGISAYSDVASITTEAIVPGAPPPPYHDNAPSPYAAVLHLNKPDYNGGAPVLEFEVQMRQLGIGYVDNESSETTIIYRGKDSYCVAKDLQPGRDYEAQVRAINRIGASAWSTWFKFTAAAAPPSPPLAPRVAIKSATQLSLYWTEPESNGASITEYRLESASLKGKMSDVNEPVLSTSSFQVCYQGLQTSADLRNLLPFTLYYFRLNASNVAGVSKWSPLVSCRTPAAVPSAPQIKDYEFTANQVALNWSEPECNGVQITSYTIECGDSSITTTVATTEYTVTNLIPQTSYKLRVQAINAVGAGPFSSYVKFSTLPSPPVPPTLECTGVSHNFIKLRWGDGKNLDFTKFYVEMYVHRAKEFQVVYSGTNCMCKVNKLQEQTAYTFRICAGTDRAGVGDYSTEYVFKTTAALPSNIKAPRIAYEGGVCLLASGNGSLTGTAAIIPSGQLQETSSSFIAGLGNVSLGLPLTLEWQHSKKSFSDRVEYVLQYAVGKNGDFKKIYRGPETKFTIENLEPGCTYQFRVCPIRVSSNPDGVDLPGQFTSSFRYQVPDLPLIDSIDGTLLSSAAGMLGASLSVAQIAQNNGTGSNSNNSSNNFFNSNISNVSFHGHSHHTHHSHGHSHHSHNHAAHSHHNSRAHHNGGVSSPSTTSTLHHRSVSASAATSSGGSASFFNGSGGNAIGIIPLGSNITNSDFVSNFTDCDDRHHHHHHHHHSYQYQVGMMMGSSDGTDSSSTDIYSTSSAAASLLAATAGTLLAHSPLLVNASTAHAQNGGGRSGALRRYTMKLTTFYSNRKRFSDQQKAVILMVSFLFMAFVFAALVKMLM